MTRISTQAANSVLLSRIFQTQQNVYERQIQVTSERKSQSYDGISQDSRRLINIENTGLIVIINIVIVAFFYLF